MKKYILMVVMLFFLLFLLNTVTNIAEPYKALSRLPRCSNNVIVTENLISTVSEKSRNIIVSGTGYDYFSEHYQLLNIDYLLLDCTFSVNYEYFYENIHHRMYVVLRVFNETHMEATEVHAFLRPVEIQINLTEAEQIAYDKEIRYDYVRREISIESQTIYYRFYQESLTQGTQIVFEIDAYSEEITKMQKPEKFVPLV